MKDEDLDPARVEHFRAVVERTIHAQTCRARTHRPGTHTQCRFPTAEALRLLEEAHSVTDPASVEGVVVAMENEGVVTWGDERHRERFLAARSRPASVEGEEALSAEEEAEARRWATLLPTGPRDIRARRYVLGLLASLDKERTSRSAPATRADDHGPNDPWGGQS